MYLHQTTLNYLLLNHFLSLKSPFLNPSLACSVVRRIIVLSISLQTLDISFSNNAFNKKGEQFTPNTTLQKL